MSAGWGLALAARQAHCLYPLCHLARLPPTRERVAEAVRTRLNKNAQLGKGQLPPLAARQVLDELDAPDGRAEAVAAVLGDVDRDEQPERHGNETGQQDLLESADDRVVDAAARRERTDAGHRVGEEVDAEPLQPALDGVAEGVAKRDQ